MDERKASETLLLAAAILRAGGFGPEQAVREAKYLQGLVTFGPVEEVARDERF